jgi:hypothetical protein
MSKQTAVQLLKESIDRELKLGTKMVVNWDMYLAMEKEQMKEMFCEGAKLLECPNELSARFEFAMYYSETYGGDK